MENADFADLIGESTDIWDQNARWWDAKMGEGNDWHRILIAPAVEELLDVRPGERVLELACGNGQFARRLASLGARVLACDSSAAFLECARIRTNEYSERIEYQMIDLTSEDQLAALGACAFDAAVCNMALMDIACITPLLRAIRRTLRADGRFVFSVPHPCFNTNGTTLLAERDDYQGDGIVTFSVRVRRWYTVYGRLLPSGDSLAAGALPLGLSGGAKLLKPIAAGELVRWSDVVLDETHAAVRCRREMETMCGATGAQSVVRFGLSS
jgi:2-polyprenyl-3-methyl-5-hydroxy-6-metoxy-1,4-benzoquinol methylase